MLLPPLRIRLELHTREEQIPRQGRLRTDDRRRYSGGIEVCGYSPRRHPVHHYHRARCGQLHEQQEGEEAEEADDPDAGAELQSGRGWKCGGGGCIQQE